VVYRNDEATVEEVAALSPVNLVISPGPGHPLKDSGISIPLIKHFAGKIPILGVCMGLQCIYSSYSGIVNFAGEILHGKTSPIEHDSRGLYANLPEDGVIGTRYHSLAAKIDTLPKELVVTSRTESGVVMGIRHTKFAMEAIQYHPESILSKGGKEMFRNFLSWTSGEWEGNPQARIDENAKRQAESTREPTLAMNGEGAGKAAAVGGAAAGAGLIGAVVANSTSASGKDGSVGTILERIHVQRLKDIAHSKSLPGLSPADLLRSLALHLAPPLIDFPSRLTAYAASGLPGVMAEMKRASPSKGDIDPLAHAGFQALSYAKGGASVISVLTEPKWFKGSLNDLRLARDAVASLPNRPALLRKDFIVDTYQIVEARLAGADTVLLIVAMLEDVLLKELYDYSVSLGMEPLVEVNNPEEMNRALAIGAKVVGVNNRNLHDFNVDMGTTSRLADAAKEGGIILCALSGITGRKDVEKYVSEGVGAVLVGEALMRSKDKKAFIHDLLGLDSTSSTSPSNGIPASVSSPTTTSPNSLNGFPASTDPSIPLVKICGISTTDAALAAVLAGADMIGMILAPGTRRSVSLQQAADIAAVVRSIRGGWDSVRNVAAEECNRALIAKAQSQAQMGIASTPELASQSLKQIPEISTPTWFNHYSNQIRSHPHKPLIVGVFRNQSLQEIIQTAKILKLDVVQLHGRIEEVEWSKWLPGVYVIRVFHVDPSSSSTALSSSLREIHRPLYHHVSALDTAAGKVSTTNGDGGSGKTFDWSIAAEIAYPKSFTNLENDREINPVMLAGGLTPDNVGEAIKALAPPSNSSGGIASALLAVDISSGVENEKGDKDNDKIREFVRRAKTALN